MGLLDLPPELLEYLLHFLPLPSLATLASTNHLLNKLCSDQFRFHSLNSLSYSPVTSAHSHSHWIWSKKCDYSYGVNDRWKKWDSRGEVLGGFNRTWSKAMPVLKIWNQPDGRGRIVIGRSNVIEVWEVDELGRSWNSHIEMIHLGGGGKKVVQPKRAGLDDITGIATVDSSPKDLIISRVSGQISRYRYEPAQYQGEPAHLIETSRYLGTGSLSSTSTVYGLQSSNNLAASITTTRPKLKPVTADSATLFPQQLPHVHSIHLHSISSPWSPPISIPYSTKPCSLLFVTPTTLVVGHTGLKPLSIHTLSQSGQPLPSSTLHYSGQSAKSSIYSLCKPHPLSSHLRPDTTIIAAYYDSTVRIYDLRTNNSQPILELSDSFNDDSAYCVASGGVQGAYIAVGTSRNAAVRVFDIRSTPSAITFFAPMKDRSPVYGIEMEFGKIWGVTECRGFSVGFEDVEGWSQSGSGGEEEISYYEHGSGAINLKKSGGGRY